MEKRMEELAELLESLGREGEDQGFTESELQRMKKAFARFKIPGSKDLHKDDLKPLLQFLGHVMTSAEGIRSIADQLNTYEYIDYDEYLDFMEKFIVYERQEFKNTFRKYDEDDSNSINLEELRKLIKELGFVTVRGMVQEALSYVDSDNSGKLDFQEFVAFLAIYRHSEGFTSSEVADLRRSYDKMSKMVQREPHLAAEEALHPEHMSDALTNFYGQWALEHSEKLREQLVKGEGGMTSSSQQGVQGEPQHLQFPEFLIMARKVREMQRVKFGQEFAAMCGQSAAEGEPTEEEQKVFTDEELAAICDADGSGGVGEEEIREVLQKNGYTPLRKVIKEIHDEVWEPGGAEGDELDFDEFFDFMITFRARDGFLKAELESFKTIFTEFDDDGSDEINVIELGDMLRQMGYRVNSEDMHDLILQVDENGSGQLDYREFVHLMRLFKERQLLRLKALYQKYKGEEGKVAPDKLKPLLQELGQELPKVIKATDDKPTDDVFKPTDAVDFEEVVEIAEKSRDELVLFERRKAGFTDGEILYFQSLFNRFDKNKSGDIDVRELQTILQEFGFAPNTRKEQLHFVKKLDAARARTREAGVEQVSKDGSPQLHFWTFVQLMRGLCTEYDKKDEETLGGLQVQLSFSEGEIEEFRQVFRMWIVKHKQMEAEAHGRVWYPDDEEKVKFGEQAKDTLPRDGLRRLIRSLGCSIPPHMMNQLDDKVKHLAVNQGRKEAPKLDFFGFLQLMRWLMDTNFASINNAAEKVIGKDQPEEFLD